ncbi:hybrid sensor histidine kinase/response regulator transcription factor [Mucilaginibacter sp. BT774]|uniref:hybrid sensor histidine kinase/response regulator transcription factor n=1 Tax=Mucilaginibacter sp. BT774 TaxID=3062276 RepID=UPI0026748559|nr:hybrid sensor histidine kinase/response regulator transcription factor [Mucilaginibacter sp. BT774]
MRFRVIITILFFFAIHSYLYAQKNIYQFSHLDISNGLSNNRVSCIFKDANGFMWFGTTSGLNRYDGYKFKVFKHGPGAPNSLIDNNIFRIEEGPDRSMWLYTHSGISVYNPNTESFANDLLRELSRYKVPTDQLTSIRKDKGGNFWFLTNNNGVYLYNPQTKTTRSYNTPANFSTILHSNNVTDIVDGRNDKLWFIYSDGVIDQLDSRMNRVLSRDFSLNKMSNNKSEIYSAILGNDGNLWIYAAATFEGVYCYNTETKAIAHYGKDSPLISLNTNVVNSIVQGNDNNIWIGTDHGGINLVDVRTHKVTYLLNKEDDGKSLSGDCVELYKDNTGIIWAGTYKQGVSYFHKGIIQFPLVKHYLSNNASLPYEDVDCFVEDANGNLWIGTNGGGLIFYDKASKKYTRFKHDPTNSKSLSNDVIVSLRIDHENRLWIGTYFGGLERLNGNTFIHYRHNDQIPGSISDDRVYSIFEDSSQKLWVGTFAGAMNIYDPQTDSFIHPHYAMTSEYTSVIYEDRQKNIWIGRDKGIDIIEKKSAAVKHYYNNPRNINSLIDNDVNNIVQDSRGFFWIGTKGGLSILNTATNIFTNVDEGKGLPTNNVLNILEDRSGIMWISTANGLVSIKLSSPNDPNSYQIHKYDEFDGLQGKEYNANAAYKTRNGEMIFGGAHGFNWFNPENIHAFSLKPKLIFTDFQLFNRSAKVGDTIEGRVILTKSITETQSLELKHNENVFSVEFAACDYFNPAKIIYQYKLDGFDKQWLVAPKGSRKATYTNMDAGDYVLRVKAGNPNDPGHESYATLNIKILPPFWKTTWAYVLYALAFTGLLLYVRHRGILNIRREFEKRQHELEAERKLAKEREEARRMHELDLMKIKFFTNVSHEFRTPLSLIISPIDTLIKGNDKPEHQQQLLMIKRNGRRLLNLVNQLLDFRKMEFKELKLNLQKGDIVHFIKEVCFSFTDMADQNNIGYIVDSEIDSLTTSFDRDKIERVLFNLLSNAFKFTSTGGHISVFLSLSTSGSAGTEQLLEIKVMDTGIGIPKEKQEKIFERFFQDNLPQSLLNQGSGIGLSISREFVRMHNGEIYVESEPGDGSCFTIRIPVCADFEKVSAAPIIKFSGNGSKSNEHILDSGKKPVILLIEDNDDLRFYLKDNLKQNFHIIEAINGKDGWQKTLAMHPDLVVSDIAMPEMNGLDLCSKIRHDERTAHTPIILLTALSEEADLLAGTECGANDYITKPFNFEILLSKINGLLQMQQTLKKTYQKQVEIQVQEMDIVSEDQKFLKNTLNCIEKNITNPNFSVEELSRQMSLSRVSLYKRLLTLTGKTPVECIRTIRLKRAVQLLEKSKLSIASIAYEVGFNNPTYFSKVFKEQYGTLPSEYLNEIRRREPVHVINEF